MDKTKVCSKCSIEKPLTVEYFSKQKTGKDGFMASCRECRKLYMKKYWELNDYKKAEYVINHKEKIAANQKQWRANNKERVTSNRRKWQKNNAELIRIGKHKRNAKKGSLESSFTKSQWEELKKEFNNSCAYCGITEEEHLTLFGERLHQDHFIALEAKGEYTHNNIIPSCRNCNSSKGVKNFFEWYPTHSNYSKQREKKILEYLGYNNDSQQLALFI